MTAAWVINMGRSGGPKIVIIHINYTWFSARRFFLNLHNVHVILNEVKDPQIK
jgi:hypothetical protein